MLDKEPLLKDATVVVHHRRLTSEGVTGWEFKEDDEYIIEIERSLSKQEYIKTLIHELVHVRQDMMNKTCEIRREEQAWALEEFYSWVFENA